MTISSQVAEFTLTRRKSDRRSPLRWVISHGLRHWWLVIIMVIGAIGNAQLAAYVPVLTGRAFNLILDNPAATSGLVSIALLIGGSQILRAILQLGRNFGAEIIAQKVERDIRRDDPYAAYDRVEWNVATWDSGDVFGKAAVRLLELVESARIIKQCLDDMPAGPIDCHLTHIPPGEGIGHAEAPRGEVFHYVRSDGGNTPVRHKIRAPSFMNIPSFKATCVGHEIADVALITAAVDPCYCCTERMAVVDSRTGDHIMRGPDLHRLSREATVKVRREVGAESPVEILTRTFLQEK